MWPYVGWLCGGGVVTWLAIELPVLQRWLDTQTLTGSQWLVVLGLSLLAPLVVELTKFLGGRRRMDSAGSA